MKSGFVAITGRPSAGKSTLINAMCGAKVAITSPVPQTTRNAIRGIVNREEGQIVFLDTPGYHDSEKKLNIYLKDIVTRSVNEADAVLYVIDASKAPGKEEQELMELLKKSGKPVTAALNKIDLEPENTDILRGIVRVNLDPADIVEVSALSAVNIEKLVSSIFGILPEGEPMYPQDFYTDQDPEFRISEIIREQAIKRTQQELPHAVYVEIADMEFLEQKEDTEYSLSGNSPGKTETEIPPGAPEGFFEDALPDSSETGEKLKTLWVRAFLVVERKSQVGILVGHKGSRIREIRKASLKELREIFPWKIRLDLRVKVNPKWRKKDMLLKKMINQE